MEAHNTSWFPVLMWQFCNPVPTKRETIQLRRLRQRRLSEQNIRRQQLRRRIRIQQYRTILRHTRCSPVISGSPYPYFCKYTSRELWINRPYSPVLHRKGPKHRKIIRKPPPVRKDWTEYDDNSKDALSTVRFSPVLGGSPYRSDRGRMTRALYMPVLHWFILTPLFDTEDGNTSDSNTGRIWLS